MALNSLFAALLPAEDKFFSQFRQMSAKIVMAADKFTTMVSSTSSEAIHLLYNEIKAIETECDHIVIHMFEQLNDTFVTPFDREDMHQLLDDLDDVMDYINASAKRMMLYAPKTMPNKAMLMCEIILEGAKAINEAFADLPILSKKPANALAQCAKLHDLEHEGDDVYDNFVKELFETESDVKELIKIKEIMQCMEEATDRANHVGKTLRTIIVKYA